MEPQPHVHALIHPHLPLRVEAHHGVRHAELVDLGRRALRQDLRERETDRLAHLHRRVEGAERRRLAGGRLQDRAFGDDHLDGVEEPLVLRDRGIDHGGELSHRIAARVREGVPHADELGSVVAAREVEGELVPFDPAVHVDMHVLVPHGVVVDENVGLVAPVRPRRDGLAEATLRLGDVPVDGCADSIGAVLRDQISQAT
jgi:hypothetical protein